MKGERGISFVEVIIALTILAMVMLALSSGFLSLSRQSVQANDRTFAAQKAMQMMTELRDLASGGSSITVLDSYDDGTNYNLVLTTKKEVTDPGDYISNNANKKYVRRVRVSILPNDSQARQVSVQIYTADAKKPLAGMVSVLRVDYSLTFPSTQVYDIFIICIENVYADSTVPNILKVTYSNAIQELQAKNPGLEFRVHWITRLSYGRDPYYTPYINRGPSTNNFSFPYVYLYPGHMNLNGSDYFFYSPSDIGGRINIDGVKSNASSYSIADQYNNAVRYPKELALYAQYSQTGQSPEISLRMLIEQMNTGAIKNAIVINIHGECLPMPPMRNYSDPAKDPDNNANIRVVTHPEQLQYASGDGVNLRVYPYVMNPSTVTWGVAPVLSAMTVLLKAGVDSSQISIRKLDGSSTTPYAWRNAVAGVDFAFSNPSAATSLITLYNSPLLHTLNGTKGLAASAQLFALEYIPCVVSTNTTFMENDRDLAWSSATKPKNTARWVIRIAPGALPDGQVTLETRIGNDPTSGSAANQPMNLSETYVWVGVTPPITEQFQFTGDPRHCPYSDVKQQLGYNWFFQNFSATNYPNFPNIDNGWNGTLSHDVPRCYYVFRKGLMRSNSVYNNVQGYNNWYSGMGGEIGAETGFPFIETPWNPSGTHATDVDEVEPIGTQTMSRIIAKTDKSWQGLYWLGELFPDSDASTWETTGNLPVGPGNYYRAKYTALTSGAFKGFPYNPCKRTMYSACVSFFNGTTAGSGGNETFIQICRDNVVADVTAIGSLIWQTFNTTPQAQIQGWRPFTMHNDVGSNTPPEWSDSPYVDERTLLTLRETYYLQDGDPDSGLISTQLGTDQGYSVINGVAMQGQIGGAPIARLSLPTVLRGFLAAGNPTITPGRIPQLPLVAISSPTSGDYQAPTSVDVSWATTWRRWDSQSYTENYPSDFVEATLLRTNIKYSSDGGKTWAFAQDGSSAKVGVVDPIHDCSSPYSWNVSYLPTGSYSLRVEVYRRDIPLHYTYHQVQINIKR